MSRSRVLSLLGVSSVERALAAFDGAIHARPASGGRSLVVFRSPSAALRALQDAVGLEVRGRPVRVEVAAGGEAAEAEAEADEAALEEGEIPQQREKEEGSHPLAPPKKKRRTRGRGRGSGDDMNAAAATWTTLEAEGEEGTRRPAFLPDAYEYDERSGCFADASTGFYYDTSTALFYHRLTGLYYRFDTDALVYRETDARGVELRPRTPPPPPPPPPTQQPRSKERSTTKVAVPRPVDDLRRWNEAAQRQRDGNGEEAAEAATDHVSLTRERPDGPDFERVVCWLCRRKFRHRETLARHAEESEMHHRNLEVRRFRRMEEAHRASSRYADAPPPPPAPPPPAPPQSGAGRPKRSRAERHRDATQRRLDETEAAKVAARPLDRRNIGYRMLVAAGWTPGTGLGPPARHGIVEPILVSTVALAVYANGGGLGSVHADAERHAAEAAYGKALSAADGNKD